VHGPKVRGVAAVHGIEHKLADRHADQDDH
jgi:hypothetical protein